MITSELRPFLISFGKFLLLGTTNLKNYWCWPEAPLGWIPTSEEPRSKHGGHKHMTQGGVGWILQLDHNGGRQPGEEDHAWQGDQQSSIKFSPQAKIMQICCCIPQMLWASSGTDPPLPAARSNHRPAPRCKDTDTPVGLKMPTRCIL